MKLFNQFNATFRRLCSRPWSREVAFVCQLTSLRSSVSRVIADIYMEDFEEMAPSSALLPRIYKRYIDDTFTILPTDKNYIFLNHLNSAIVTKTEKLGIGAFKYKRSV